MVRPDTLPVIRQYPQTWFPDNVEIPTDLRQGALALQRASEWDDEAGEHTTSHEDDEYRWAGVEDPKIVVTTSRDPSSRLKMFAKVRFALLLSDTLFPQLCR